MDPDHSTLPQLVPADAQGVAAEPAAPRQIDAAMQAEAARFQALAREQNLAKQ